jgi:hypothetical protein
MVKIARVEKIHRDPIVGTPRKRKEIRKGDNPSVQRFAEISWLLQPSHKFFWQSMAR